MAAACIHVGESDALHARARAFVRAFEAHAPMPETFDALAADLARYQARHVPGYARLCAARGVEPAGIRRAADAPAVPAEAFKLARVSAFPQTQTPVVFRTSGTTVGQRGEHPFRTTTTYDMAALAFGRHALRAGLDLGGSPVPVLVLGPPPAEMPDSSLVHMMDFFARSWGTPATSEETYFLRDGILDLAALDERVARLLYEGAMGTLVLGTSLAFAHLVEGLGEERFRMPPATRVMQTGGFKGKSVEVDAPELRRRLAQAFCIDERAVVSEYGMTELSSQAYEGTLLGGAPGLYVEPPWMRVVAVDPETLAPVPLGEAGIARIEDLCNVDSAFAVVTADRVRRADEGFELLGRVEGSPPRGCSLATEELLSGADREHADGRPSG